MMRPSGLSKTMSLSLTGASSRISGTSSVPGTNCCARAAALPSVIAAASIDTSSVARKYMGEAYLPTGPGATPGGRSEIPCAEAREVSGDAGVDPLGREHVGVGARGIALDALGLASPVECARELRRHLQGGVVVRDREVELPHLEVGEAAIVEGRGGAGLDLEGLRAVRHRLLEAADDRPVAAAVGERVRIAGFQPDHLVPILDRAVVLAERAVGIGPGCVSVGEGWVKLDRLVVVGDGVLVVALHQIGVAAVVIGRPLVGRELDRAAKLLDGAVVVGLGVIGDAEVELGVGRVVGAQLDDLREILDGAVVVALVAVGEAAIPHRRRCAGLELNGLAEILDGAVVLSLAAVG